MLAQFKRSFLIYLMLSGLSGSVVGVQDSERQSQEVLNSLDSNHTPAIADSCEAAKYGLDLDGDGGDETVAFIAENVGGVQELKQHYGVPVDEMMGQYDAGTDEVFVANDSMVYVQNDVSESPNYIDIGPYEGIYSDAMDCTIDGVASASSSSNSLQTGVPTQDTTSNIDSTQTASVVENQGTEPPNSLKGFLSQFLIGLLSTEALAALSTAVVVVLMVVVWNNNRE